jgi:alkylhydroperoxidase family enzyme
MTANRSPRIPPLPLAECRDDVRAMLAGAQGATGGASNVFATLARHPGVFKQYMAFVSKLFARGTLTVLDRELLVVRTAHLCNSAYESAQHDRIGREVGLRTADLEALAVGPTDPRWGPRERSLLLAADSLVLAHTIDEHVWNDLTAWYDDAQMIEITLVVGHYAMLAGFLNAAAVQIESDDR